MAIKTFTKNKRDKSILLRTDNMATLYYLNKMGGTKNTTLSTLAQETWNYLISRRLSLTVEHIQGVKNEIADSKSRMTPDSSE